MVVSVLKGISMLFGDDNSCINTETKIKLKKIYLRCIDVTFKIVFQVYLYLNLNLKFDVNVI